MERNGNKGIGAGWFKSNILNKTADDEILEEEEVLEEDKEEIFEDKSKDVDQIKNMLSKNNKDKIVLDLIMPLENLIKDRQMVILNNDDLEDKLRVANEAIDRMKKNIEAQEVRLESRDREIQALENNLSNKQMSYDQLLEDYREFQKISSNEYEDISNRLNMEVNKYKRFNEEVANDQYVSMQKINTLEEKIRSLEIEKQQYLDNYNRVYQEKNDLMKSIDDFTKRMTFSFPTKGEEETRIEEEPRVEEATKKPAPVEKPVITEKKEEFKKNEGLAKSDAAMRFEKAISSKISESQGKTLGQGATIKPGTTISPTTAIKPGTTISPGTTGTRSPEENKETTNSGYPPNATSNQNIMDAINRIRTINTGKAQE